MQFYTMGTLRWHLNVARQTHHCPIRLSDKAPSKFSNSFNRNVIA